MITLRPAGARGHFDFGWLDTRYDHVAKGSVTLNGTAMNAGDAARIEGEPSITVVAVAPSEILLFDLA